MLEKWLAFENCLSSLQMAIWLPNNSCVLLAKQLANWFHYCETMSTFLIAIFVDMFIFYLFTQYIDFHAEIERCTKYWTSYSNPQGRERRIGIITEQGEVAIYPAKARINRSWESEHRPSQGNLLVFSFTLVLLYIGKVLFV